ncbi:MAG TPA: phosphodiesterase YaeI [Bryobacteraceae bacterium]|nr:phosphodiesterase YaeI [Bryobacteraceae bacterium]
MTRRSLLLGSAAMASTAIGYPCFYEPRWLESTERRVRISGAKLQHPIRILHLSDLHASFVVPMSLIRHSIGLGLDRKPDIICLTGDFITFRHDFDAAAYLGALKQLSAAAPTYAVLGNHDGGNWARWRRGYSDHKFVERLLEDSGIRLLHNRSESLTVRDQRVTLVGVGDLWSREVDGDRAFAGVRDQEPIVLLAHNPDTKDKLASFPWGLMLSGHTHGGQVIVQRHGGARYAPVVDKRYISGLKPWGTRQIYVTRGVGNVGGVRFRCRPEVSSLLVG